MTEPTRKNMSASVRARLLNLARSTNRNFQELTMRYAVERFLVRLALSKHKDQFILKGAMLYIAWKLDEKRTTMDLDLLGIGSPDPERLADVFRQTCEVHIEDDGLLFGKDSVTAGADEIGFSVSGEIRPSGKLAVIDDLTGGTHILGPDGGKPGAAPSVSVRGRELQIASAAAARTRGTCCAASSPESAYRDHVPLETSWKAMQ